MILKSNTLIKKRNIYIYIYIYIYYFFKFKVLLFLFKLFFYLFFFFFLNKFPNKLSQLYLFNYTYLLTSLGSRICIDE